jgi:BASS family bile acid:Na+ symporter
MAMTLVLLVKVSVVLLVLAIGMSATPSALGWLWRRPRLLGRSLLAMYLLVPLSALALAEWLPVGRGTKAALLVLAVSAGAPLVPRRLASYVNPAYVFSLVATSSLVAIVLVPAWLALIGAHFGIEIEVTLATVAWALAKAFLLPLGIGMGLRAAFPERGAWLAERLLRVAGLTLTACVVALLATHWEVFTLLPWQGVAALLLQMVLALAIGHALGGPEPENRTALAIACATRHIGIALIVATTFPGVRTAVVIVAYLLCSFAATMPYLVWRRRVSGGAAAASPAG